MHKPNVTTATLCGVGGAVVKIRAKADACPRRFASVHLVNLDDSAPDPVVCPNHLHRVGLASIQ
jgi:hypothetical protein